MKLFKIRYFHTYFNLPNRLAQFVYMSNFLSMSVVHTIVSTHTSYIVKQMNESSMNFVFYKDDPNFMYNYDRTFFSLINFEMLLFTYNYNITILHLYNYATLSFGHSVTIHT